ncbi:competence protein CoiA [Streptomyces anulatus]|uniref:competence protein CoiA n=1 Tax=Streptomyces anulatus TaxID=1892 RepID=UPI002257F5B9|nr:competence protein CoiA family protein [Streptomyces anulatus]MCX4506732.1 competence protein CoiA family protein [Streptomyces anulatus]
MPFTALHADLGRLDATLPDLGQKLEWSQIHKVRPRPPLVCPECEWGLHAKVSGQGMPFFAHDPGRPPSCELANESWEHHMLKLEMAAAIREVGWFAELEVPAADGSWRADVMATSTDGTQRMAWEAQLSPITVDDIHERTERYRAEDIRVCWVSPNKKPPQWISAVPAVRVRAPAERGEVWMVDDGVAGFDYRAGGWAFREERLPQFVRWVLNGQLVSVESYPRYRRVPRVVDGEQLRFRRGRWWTSLKSSEDQTRHELKRQGQEAAKEEREARRQQQEEKAEQRRKELEEKERIRKAEEAERLRRQREEEARIRMAEWDKRWAEEEAQRAQEKAEEARRLAVEQAEREERERQTVAAATSWWRRLSKQQIDELFAAVAERAWREEKLWLAIPDEPKMDPTFAYGVPLYCQRNRRRSLYGVVRPCPSLVTDSPRTREEHALVRSPQEAKELEEAGHGGRITHFDFPEHEQLAMY